MSSPQNSEGTVQKLAQQLEPQWLIDAQNHLKKKHKPSYDVLTKDTTNDSMLQMLEVGAARENELRDRHNRGIEDLVHHRDLNKRLIRHGTEFRLVFEPYQRAGEAIRKFVKANIDIPAYDGTRTPEENGQACTDHIKKVARRRLRYVEQHLSQDHKYYAEKNINTKANSVGKAQITEAKESMLRDINHPLPGTRDIVNLPSVIPESVLVHATTGPISSPIEAPLSERVSVEHSDRTPVTGFRAIQREGLSPSPLTPGSRKRFRVDSEQVPAEIELPSSNSQTTRIHRHGSSLEIEPNSNVPARPNPIDDVTFDTQPTLPINHSLLQSAITKVQDECSEQLDSLLKEAPCGIYSSFPDRAIRAIQFGLEHRPACEPYKRISATLTNWVLFLGDEEPSPACVMKEIDAEIRNRIFDDGHKIERQILELHASSTVRKKMNLIRRQQSAVLSLMTIDDRNALDIKISQKRKDLMVSTEREILYGHIRSLREKESSSAQQTQTPWPQADEFPW